MLAMIRATLTIAAVALLCITAAAAPLVTYESPCECRDNHGKHRWAEKNDPALPPSDASAIQAVTPSDIFNWQGPTEPLKSSSERIVAEQKFYALTGRVVELRADADGDLHIALADASGDSRAASWLRYQQNRVAALSSHELAKIHEIKRTLGARIAE
jgi:hypothetical protein